MRAVYQISVPKAKAVRGDEWRLAALPGVIRMAGDTIDQYRRCVTGLCGILRTNWPEVSALPVQQLELLFHDTGQRGPTRYGAWFSRNFPKMPSYLRRAATMAAHGAVSSFMTRYHAWQGGGRRDAGPGRQAW